MKLQIFFLIKLKLYEFFYNSEACSKARLVLPFSVWKTVAFSWIWMESELEKIWDSSVYPWGLGPCPRSMGPTQEHGPLPQVPGQWRRLQLKQCKCSFFLKKCYTIYKPKEINCKNLKIISIRAVQSVPKQRRCLPGLRADQPDLTSRSRWGGPGQRSLSSRWHHHGVW